MGITGLIPFLEKSSKKTNISEFAGGTVVVDTYCWLHKGAFSCADKLVMGQETDAYVKYCMKFVNMLLGHNIKPILVFDGRHLPAKAETESKRRESRDANRKRAADLIKMGRISEGKNLLRRSLDVSHKMALEVIKECQKQNVDCIVAPYEADAQLAYLNISGIADVVITEDSDLTLFGCKNIFFKMDLYGNGVLVQQDKLHLAMNLRRSDFHIDKFRYMCILSGCDYLASLPGIGLQKALKFILKNTDDNIYNALQRLGSNLNMKSLTVTKEYRDNFMRALVTFKHQLVYCPLQRKQVRLNPPMPDVTEEQLQHAGTEIDEQLAWQLALGNCDPFTKEKLHHFDPDNSRPKVTNAWSGNAVSKHISIWSTDFKVKDVKEKKPANSPMKKKSLTVRTPSTRGKIMVMKTDSLNKEITPKKRTYEESEMTDDEIVQMYKQQPKIVSPKKSAKPEPGICSSEDATSPILIRRSNPFRKASNSSDTSPSLIQKFRRRIPRMSRFKPTVIDDTAVKQSEFFAPKKIEREELEKTEKKEANINVLKKIIRKDNEECKDNVIIPETEAFDDEVADFQDRVLVPDTEDSDDEADHKENLDMPRSRVIIPETEDFEEKEVDSCIYDQSDVSSVTSMENLKINVFPQQLPNTPQKTVNKDSGHKESSIERDINPSAMNWDDSVTEKEPLQLVNENLLQKKKMYKAEFREETKQKEEIKMSVDDDEDFSVTKESFSEYRSSLFTYRTPISEPISLKRGSLSQSSKRSSQLSQESLNRRIVKSTLKKSPKIHGQQSLLNTKFGFQKKNTLKH